MTERNEMVSWDEVSRLVDHLLPQFNQVYTVMVMITRGGIIPGGMLAEAMGIRMIFTASVDFPAELHTSPPPHSKFLTWPKFLQFPAPEHLNGQHVLIVDDVWGSGRTITAVRNRVNSSGGEPATCVLHFNPSRNLFGNMRPDYYAATTDAHIIYPWEMDRGFQSNLFSGIR
ncbi:MAG: phosphoribosyltransferase family protein [Anaerolineaceae bacterium]